LNKMSLHLVIKMSYSPQLVYFLDRLSGFSTNTFKLLPSGSRDNIAPGSITRFTLPANALLNTRSFKCHFAASATGTNGRLPADISTLVERVEVSAGGVQISQGANYYNVLCNAKAAIMGSRCDSVTGHSEMVTVDRFDGAGALNAANETYSSTAGRAPHVIDKWEGFLGTCEPKILDAAILPDLVVSIYWTTQQVCSSVKNVTTSTLFSTKPDAGASASYSIDGLFATIETIGLADSVYDNMVSSMIAQKGFVEIPFKQYFAFQNVHSGNSRFTVATQSLDRVWMAYRHADYNTAEAAIAVPGYSTALGITDLNGEASSVFSTYGGKFGTGATEKYISHFQRFAEPGADGALTYQLQLNGAYYPQFAADTYTMYQITKNSLVGPVKYDLTNEQLRNSNFVQCVRLNMPDSEFSRTISGLDTRSVSLNGYVITAGTLKSAGPGGAAGNPDLMIFCECTSTLRVGAGRQLEVIV
jgi:hypothetical protein